MTRVIRTALLAAAATLAVALSAGPAAAAGSPTLGGERLMNQTANDPQATCMTFGGGFNYTVSGRAVGAYAGTFTETGTVRTAGDTMTSPIISVQASFTITSPAGIVTGTRTYTPGFSTGSGGCESGWTNDNARLFAQKVGYTSDTGPPVSLRQASRREGLVSLASGERKRGGFRARPEILLHLVDGLSLGEFRARRIIYRVLHH